MFTKNKTQRVCSGPSHQTQVERMLPVRKLTGVDCRSKQAARYTGSRLSPDHLPGFPAPPPDQGNTDRDPATQSPPSLSYRCEQPEVE